MFTKFFVQIISEAVKPTKVKTASQTFNIPSAEDDVHLPSLAPEPTTKGQQPTGRRSLGRTASAKQTAGKTSNISMDDRAGSMLRSLLSTDIGANEPDSEMDVSTEVVTPEDVPAVISSALADAGVVTPEWHMVRNLPGYMQKGIKALGKMVFNQYTRTSIDQVQVLASLQGQGPNTEREINAVASWAVKNGTKATQGNIDFSKIMPGYDADVAVYNVEGSQLMIVSDQFGKYIYAWPEADTTLNDLNTTRSLK